MNTITVAFVTQLAERLRAAKHGEREAIKDEARKYLGCSLPQLHRHLSAVGYETGRKRRSDAGQTAASLAELQLVSGLVVDASRANGKRTLTIDQAVEIAKANGQLTCNLSAKRIAVLMQENGCHPDQILAPSAHIQQRSLHPNHVWQIDASVCTLYYLSNGLEAMDRAKFYKNKPENFRKIESDRLIRYVLTDHYSGAIRHRYCLGSETALNMLEFFAWAIQKRDGDPFHGVPFILMMDPGAANEAKSSRNFFERMQVELLVNLPGQPRAKGSVESAQNIVERSFEGLLKNRPIRSLDELNTLADRWGAAFNASATHSRHGQSRYSAWLRIAPDQLRIAPPLDLCLDLVTTQPETRVVAGDLTISYACKGHGSRSYDVRFVPGVHPKSKVEVVVNPYRAPAVDVKTVDDQGRTVWITVEPLETQGGFRVDAPIIGQEYRGIADTAPDTQRKELLKGAYGAGTLEEAETAKKKKARAYSEIDTFKHVEETFVPDYLPKRGTALDISERSVALAPLNLVEACRRIKDALGNRYDATVYAWVSQRFGETGVPEEQLDAIVAQFGGATVAHGDVPALKAVGGKS